MVWMRQGALAAIHVRYAGSWQSWMLLALLAITPAQQPQLMCGMYGGDGLAPFTVSGLACMCTA